MGQLLLIPDPRPLDERLGGDFFRTTPRQPGVYLMRDAMDEVLYVGKARDLRQRLNNYRLANPDRMPRRHLRMVREVARIEIQICSTESDAARHESKLIRSLKPRFNRAGVWPGSPKFIAWQRHEDRLELAVADIPESRWRRVGPVAGARYLHRSLARVLWLVANPGRRWAELPAGWVHGRFAGSVIIDCGKATEKIAHFLDAFLSEEIGSYIPWLRSFFSDHMNPFDRSIVDAELEALDDFIERRQRIAGSRLQPAML